MSSAQVGLRAIRRSKMTLETEGLRNIEKIALRKIYCLKLLLEKRWQRV